VWQQIRYTTKEPSGQSVTRVETIENGTTVVHDDQDSCERALMSELSTRFSLANSAPICKGWLHDRLGYLADTATAQSILDGSFQPPPDLDPATTLLLQEISRIAQGVVEGSIDIEITEDDFRYYWKTVPERISSSYSTLHFGHYKSATASDFLTKLHAKHLTAISRAGSPPDRWSGGLTVMLEKIAGVALVNKLRAILLMEADFNFHNKLIFGRRMLKQARLLDLIPGEQFNEKENTADDGVLEKVLLFDISRQTRRATAVASVDAANCYDRISHALMSLTFLAFGVGMGPVAAMLLAIQNMQFFLRTGFGESTVSYGSSITNLLQGLCQGNGAAPPGWQLLSALMITVHKAQGFGMKLLSPITGMLICLAGILYVDDTDLIQMGADQYQPERRQQRTRNSQYPPLPQALSPIPTSETFRHPGLLPTPRPLPNATPIITTTLAQLPIKVQDLFHDTQDSLESW
jgi:hypothetical protein